MRLGLPKVENNNYRQAKSRSERETFGKHIYGCLTIFSIRFEELKVIYSIIGDVQTLSFTGSSTHLDNCERGKIKVVVG